MNIEEAIKILDKFVTEHKLFNIKHSDGLEEAIETLLTAYKKEKEDNKQWEKYATNDLENQITERDNKIFELKAELEQEKEKNKELEKENKKLNLVRLQYLVSSFPDTTETYKKYKKELDELLREE